MNGFGGSDFFFDDFDVPKKEITKTRETREVPPAHLLLKIESFSLLCKNGVLEYESREFEAGDLKWKLIIHLDCNKNLAQIISDSITLDPPNNESRKYADISAYLSVADTSSLPEDWEVNTIFSIFLLDQITDKYTCFGGTKVQRFSAMNMRRGFSKMITASTLTDPSNGYIVNDNCVFGAEVFVLKTRRVIEIVKATDPLRKDFAITKFSKLQGVWTSPEFTAGGYKWKLKLYPNGYGNGEGRYISVYLELVDAMNFGLNQKVKAHIWISIKRHNVGILHSSNSSHLYTSSKQAWGYSKFISIAEFQDPNRSFLVNDCCTLETKISVQAVQHDVPAPVVKGECIDIGD